MLIEVNDDLIPKSCNKCDFVVMEKGEYDYLDGEIFKCPFTGVKFSLEQAIHCRVDTRACPFKWNQ